MPWFVIKCTWMSLGMSRFSNWNRGGRGNEVRSSCDYLSHILVCVYLNDVTLSSTIPHSLSIRVKLFSPPGFRIVKREKKDRFFLWVDHNCAIEEFYLNREHNGLPLPLLGVLNNGLLQLDSTSLSLSYYQSLKEAIETFAFANLSRTSILNHETRSSLPFGLCCWLELCGRGGHWWGV